MQSTKGAEAIRILLVDDHPMVRAGIRFLIDNEPDMEVCGESRNSSEALAKLAELRPAVATVDLNLGSENGLDVVRQMRARDAALKILVLSMHEESRFVEIAAAAGADGYVAKLAATQTLAATIRILMLPKSTAACP